MQANEIIVTPFDDFFWPLPLIYSFIVAAVSTHKNNNNNKRAHHPRRINFFSSSKKKMKKETCTHTLAILSFVSVHRL